MIRFLTQSLFQNKRNTRRGRFGGVWTVLTLTILITWLFFVPGNAQAASVTERRPIALQIELSELDDMSHVALNWKKSSAVLDFDMPENDWVDDLSLTLAAHPDGPVNARLPLIVKFNDGNPITLPAKGYPFRATIRLDPSTVKAHRNRLQISYGTASPTRCPLASEGAWVVDLGSSKLSVNAHSRSRAMTFRDFKTTLSSPATQPSRVALRAAGENKLMLQVLMAQGATRNIDYVPDFETETNNAEAIIVAATRDNLRGLISRSEAAKLSKSSGAILAITRSHPPRLVITADNEADLIAAVKTFAETPMPASRQSQIAPGTYYLSRAFDTGPRLSKGRFPLAELGPLEFDDSWAPRPAELSFDVTDPAVTYGTLNLALGRGPATAPNSKVLMSLNGHNLSAITLGQKTVKTKIDIPLGVLNGIDNKLVLTPILEPNNPVNICGAGGDISGLSILPRSNLVLKTAGKSPEADLSRFAATGAPFAHHNSADYVEIHIAADKPENLEASLKLLSHIGQKTDTSWVSTPVVAIHSRPIRHDGHVLVIAPSAEVRSLDLQGAPKSLTDSLANLSPTITAPSSASLYGRERVLSNRAITRGGLAAIFEDKAKSGRIIGIISTTPGENFTRAVDDLVSLDIWNALEGRVVRWNSDGVMLMQTSLLPETAIAKPPPAETLKPRMSFSAPELPKVEFSLSEWFSGIKGKFSRPEKVKPEPPAEPDKPYIVFPKPGEIPLIPRETEEAMPKPVKPKDLQTQEAQNPQTPTLPSPTLKPANMADRPESTRSAGGSVALGTPVPEDKPETAEASAPNPQPDLLVEALDRDWVGDIQEGGETAYTSMSSGLQNFISRFRTGPQVQGSQPERPKFLVFAVLGALALFAISLIAPTRRERES